MLFFLEILRIYDLIFLDNFFPDKLSCSYRLVHYVIGTKLTSDNNLYSTYFSSQQVKSGIHQSRLTLCDVLSPGTSPGLPFSGTSLPPMLHPASQHAEGNGNKVLFLANNDSVNKSETPEPLSDKPTCVSFPAAEVAKTQDYPCPQPIPEGKNGMLPACTNQICWTKDIHCLHCFDDSVSLAILLKLNRFCDNSS